MALFEHGYALLIGVDQCMEKKWSLPGVSNDITALERVLVNPAYCAYPAGNIKSVTGSVATRRGILDGLAWLGERIGNADHPNTTGIIYYSGHGWRNLLGQTTSYHLIPYDFEEKQSHTSTLRASDFGELVAALNPRRLLVVMDCCHSGGMNVKGEGAKNYAPDGFEPAAVPTVPFLKGEKSLWTSDSSRPHQLANGEGRAVLSSSTGTQLSYMLPDNRMSIFTYQLVQALTGNVSLQENSNEILVSDVMSYVWNNVPACAKKEWGEEQVPYFNVSGNFPIALKCGGNNSKGKLDLLHSEVDRIRLKNVLLDNFNLEELEELCNEVEVLLEKKNINVRVSLEMVGGQMKSAKIVNLMGYMRRKQLLSYLIEVIRVQRPGII